MNIESLVAHSAKLMEAAAKVNIGKLHLCYCDGRLQCLSVKHSHLNHVILFTFRTEDWQKGLTTEDWNQIRTEISKLTKELEQCLSKLHKTTNGKSNQSKT